ncbi:hypothetical protein Daus18300_007929 [Diaporthe australafricana]|uniref:Uncharacterized protein n=1 Tax=Diaporthe australafricana TaxID=127596 RepID=A0ABR3WJY5_9PEZI
MPPKHPSALRKKYVHAVTFYITNLKAIKDNAKKEDKNIDTAMDIIKSAEHSVHPLWRSVHGDDTETVTPTIDDCRGHFQTNQWEERLSEQFNRALKSADRCAKELKAITKEVRGLRSPENKTIPDRPQLDLHGNVRSKLAALFTALVHKDQTRCMNYLRWMAILIYSTMKSIQFLTHVIDAWTIVLGGSSQVNECPPRAMMHALQCSKALFGLQRVLNHILRAPWTVACALHLLRVRPKKASGGRKRSTPGDDSGDKHTVDEKDELNDADIESSRPSKHVEVFRAVKNKTVRSLLENSFRVDAIHRRHLGAQAIINKFWPGGKILDIEFVSNRGGRRIQKEALRQTIREYWRQNAECEPREDAREGLGLLLRLSELPQFNENDIGLDLSIPKAHCECMLAQHWFSTEFSRYTTPAIGVSRNACGTCTLFFKAVRNQMCPETPLEEMIPGTRDAFWPCMIPEKTPEKIKREVSDGLREKLMEQLSRDDVVNALKRSAPLRGYVHEQSLTVLGKGLRKLIQNL